MTIKEMRSEMRREIVPEEVVPQNVVNCLIDEDAEPPKPDAFTFLTRLRALGIGSDDFLNLLEGCGAPESAVNRIRQNPAMNLQGLILTLEDSELTSDDYTRMLLTARQVWERTLTLRLEKSEKIWQEMNPDAAEEPDYEPVKVYDEPADNGSDEQAEAETEYIEDDEEDTYYDEDMREMSFTAVFNKINCEMREGTFPYSNVSNEPEPQRDADEKYTEENEISEALPETQSSADENVSDNEAESGDDTELSFPEAFDKIKKEKRNDTAGGVSDTTMLIRIDEEMLRENFGKLSTKSENLDEKEPEEAYDKAPGKLPKTAKQKKSKETADNTPENSEEYEDTSDKYDESTGDEPEENGEGSHRVYYKGAVIGSAVGAAVLIGAGFFAGKLLGGKDAKNLHYAADNSEIFDKIYYAYSDSITGGSAASGIGDDHYAIFGDLLISGDDDKKSLGSFSIGTGLYSITEEAISANIVENGTITPLDDLIPPENSRFVAAFDDNGELYALFSGKQSGFMKISDGKAEYTVRQDGILTDYNISDGEMRLGTVYTPVFGHTFSINDEDVYLPRVGTEAPKPISPQKVIISDTKGYSYGVSAGYSTKNGSVNDVRAVIGDPVAASADGRFALNGENGLLVKTNGEQIITGQTGKLSHAAFGKNGCAITEESSEGGSENIKLLDNKFNTSSVLTGITEKIEKMWFDGNFLTINGITNGILRVECSDFNKPEPLRLKSSNGIIAGRSALTCGVTDSAFVITRYDLKNSAAEKVGEYSKMLTAEQLATARLGDPKTAVINGSKSGVAYSYFDGVSVISEYAVFADGEQPNIVTVFDDKTGFTAAFKDGNAVNAICAEGVKVLQ